MKQTNIKDIFDGNIITVWEDGKFIFLSFPWVTINFPKEDWKEVKKDLDTLSKVKNII